MLAFFPSLDGAGDAVARIVAAGTNPVTLELLDKPDDRGGRRRHSSWAWTATPRRCSSSSRTAAEPAASAELDEAVRACEAAGATSIDARRRRDRGRLAPPGPPPRAPRPRAPGHRSGWRTSACRGAACRTCSGRFRAIGEKYDIRIATFGHAGDGNLHPNFIFDHDDPRAEELTDLARADLYRAAIELGGTVTAEHGIGLARRDALVEQVGPDVVGVMRSIKAALDPQGILNPGRVF